MANRQRFCTDGGCNYNAAEDFNLDNAVDGAATGADFLIWRREHGAGAIVPMSAAATVQEPNAIVLLCGLFVELWRGRWA